MFSETARRRAIKRVTPGAGRALTPFRWWQPFSRALFSLQLRDAAGRRIVYSVEAYYLTRAYSGFGKGKAHLYLDGRHIAESSLPAAFPVEGGWIEVVPTAFGLKRCHYVTTEGVDRQLTPDASSAEGRRARLARDLPALSRAIGVVSITLLIVSLLLLIPQLVEVVFQIPPIAHRFGSFDWPIELPWWLNVLLAGFTAAATAERALRLRHSWLDSAN